MAEKLHLSPEVQELKIGSSFFDNSTAFHSLRYDFKPASVVSGSKHATIEIGPNQQVTVTHLESSGAPQTIFKGSRRPYQKECVLIIDKITGEITLEKLTTNIQLKKTRQEGGRSGGGYTVKQPSPPQRGGVVSRGRPRHSPNPSPQYPHRNSPLIVHKSPPQLSNLSLSPSPAASLPMIDDGNDSSSSSFDIANALSFPELKASPEFSNFHEEDGGGAVSNQVGILSDSSSDSSSDSNSSDSEDDRPSNAKQPPAPPPPKVNGHMNGKSSTITNHFLSEDLQLSESGSDSD